MADTNEFLETTLAGERLSGQALLHRTRLMLKIVALMKKDDRPTVDMYIDMKSDPTLRSFFSSDSSTTASMSLSVGGGALGTPALTAEEGS